MLSCISEYHSTSSALIAKFRESQALYNSTSQRITELKRQRHEEKIKFEQNHLQLEQQIFAEQAKINRPEFDQQNLFRAACRAGDMQLVNDYFDLDLLRGANISYSQEDNQDCTDCDPINNAIKGDHPEMLELLINRTANCLYNKVYNHIECNEVTVKQHLINVIEPYELNGHCNLPVIPADH